MPCKLQIADLKKFFAWLLLPMFVFVGFGAFAVEVEKASAAQEKLIGSNTPLYRVCGTAFPDVIRVSNAIFVGEALEVHSKYPHPRSRQTSSCWIKFRVKEWLKRDGEKPSEIWVENVINYIKNTEEDFASLRYCEYETGKSYVIYGYFYKSVPIDDQLSWPVLVKTASNRGNKNNPQICPPNQEVDDNYNDYGLIQYTRRIIDEESKGNAVAK